MIDRRELLAEVFQDTQKFYTEDLQLREAVVHSMRNTVLYAENDEITIPERRKDNGEIVVTKQKSFEAACCWHKEHPDDRITVLNFASAVTPGGGVKRGSSAQEESLCRCSTLYPTLNQKFLWDSYYNKNRAAKNVLHTDDCILSPDVIICKTDENVPQRMRENDWVTVNIISCAAPNLRQNPYNEYNPEGGTPVHITPMELIGLHEKRARRIFSVAAAHNTDVLVLGAFGCGAFENNPWLVAEAYELVIPMFKDYFKRIEFAIYCRRNETTNYDAFRETLN